VVDLLQDTLVGDSHKGPVINREKPISSQKIKTQTNSQIVNYTSRNHGLVTGAHDPRNLSGPSSGRSRHPSGETPPRSRGPVPYYRNSTSLEGWTPPQAKLRLSRGLDAPSGETPPRSRSSRARGPSGFQPGHPSSRSPPCSRAMRTLYWAQARGLDARLHFLSCTQHRRVSMRAHGTAEAG
jgi:hypothetical protein